MSKAPVAYPSKDNGSVDAWAVVYFFYEHISLILLCAFLGLVLALVYVVETPPSYRSRAVLEVASAAPISLGSAVPRDVNPDSAALLKTVEQSLASPSVLDRVIKQNHLADDPDYVSPDAPNDPATLRKLLQERISAELIRGTRLIAVTAESSNPFKARDLAQSVVDAFFARNLDEQRKRAEASRQFLLTEVRRQAEELNRAEQRLQDFREKAGTVGLADQRSIDVNYLGNLHSRLSEATGTRLKLESLQSQVEAALQSGAPDQLLKLQVIADTPEIAKLRQQKNDETTRMAALAERYRARHPAMIQAQRQLAETRTLLAQTARSAAESILHAYQAAKGTEEKLQQEIARLEQKSVDSARVGITYRSLERELKSDTALYQQLLDRLKETDVTQNMAAGHPFSGSLVELSEAPQVPDTPAQFPLHLVLPAGLLAGGMLGGMLALGLRALDDSVSSVDIAEACLGIATLTVVPLSRRIGFRRGRLRKPRAGLAEAEAFRSLRTSLSLLSGEVPNKAIMFTSAVSGEGKSCCSTNYATIVALSGLRTLLIDGDLRRPQLRRAFNRQKYNTKPDVAACLSEPERFATAVEPTSVPNLFLLGSSQGTAQAADLLANGNLPLLLAQCLAQFDHVVIDTAPVAVVSDALHFARHVPTICLVVHARRTPRRIVQRACRLLTDVGGRPLTGVILNQIRPNRASHYHYYYHSSRHYAENLSSITVPG